jgi:hypothetical protein
MDSPPTSRLRFLSVEGSPIETPREWTPALVEVLVDPEERSTVRLWRQGESLPVYLKVIRGKERVLADWPRSEVGHFKVLLETPGAVEEQAFSILPEKISTYAYEQMLEDLEKRLPAAVAVALQKGGGLAGMELPPPEETTLAQELVLLRKAILGTKMRPGLNTLLPEIERNPHQILRTNELWMQRERARRPSAARLVQAYNMGHNLDEQNQPVRVVDTRVEHTVDVYENRLVKVYYEQVARRLHRLHIVLSAGANSGAREGVESLRRVLSLARRQARFLDNVSLPAYLPTWVTMVLAKRPPYRAALEGYLELHRRVSVHLDEPAFDAPLENLPYLYQIWGTLEVILALQTVGSELGYKVKEERLVRREGQSVFVRVLPDGNSALTLEHPERLTTVRLISERTYGKSGKLRSISYQQRPDIAVEVVQPGQPVRVYLFDPKYKLWGETLAGGGQRIFDAFDKSGYEDILSYDEEAQDRSKPTKVDIDKMHAYRDAIRGEAGERVVQYASILYPGQTVSYSSGLAALRAVPGESADLMRNLCSVLGEALAHR